MSSIPWFHFPWVFGLCGFLGTLLVLCTSATCVVDELAFPGRPVHRSSSSPSCVVFCCGRLFSWIGQRASSRVIVARAVSRRDLASCCLVVAAWLVSLRRRNAVRLGFLQECFNNQGANRFDRAIVGKVEFGIQDMIEKFPPSHSAGGGQWHGHGWGQRKSDPEVQTGKSKREFLPRLRFNYSILPAPVFEFFHLAIYHWVESILFGPEGRPGCGCVGYPDVAHIDLHRQMSTNITNSNSRHNEHTLTPPKSDTACECLIPF